MLPENFILQGQEPSPLIFAIVGSQFYTIHIQKAYSNQAMVTEGILGSPVPVLTNPENSNLFPAACQGAPQLSHIPTRFFVPFKWVVKVWYNNIY